MQYLMQRLLHRIPPLTIPNTYPPLQQGEAVPIVAGIHMEEGEAVPIVAGVVPQGKAKECPIP